MEKDRIHPCAYYDWLCEELTRDYLTLMGDHKYSIIATHIAKAQVAIQDLKTLVREKNTPYNGRPI